MATVLATVKLTCTVETDNRAFGECKLLPGYFL